MRLFFILVALLIASPSVYAQGVIPLPPETMADPEPVPVPAPAPAPTSTPTPAIGKVSDDWKTIGKPIDNDTKDMRDRYVYFNEDATDKNVAQDNPVLSPQELRDWVRQYVSYVFNINGQTFDQQTVANRRLFTPRGYADYITAMRNSKIDAYLKKNRYKLSGVIVEEPMITAKGLRKVVEKGKEIEVYVWQVETKIYLAYLDYANEVPEPLRNKQDSTQNRNTFTINMKVELVRIPMQSDGNLVAINTLLFDNQQIYQ